MCTEVNPFIIRTLNCIPYGDVVRFVLIFFSEDITNVVSSTDMLYDAEFE